MQFHSDYNYFVRYIPGVGWNPHSKNTLISNSYSGSSKRIGKMSSGSRLTVPGAWWWNQEKELASLAGLVIVVEYLFFTGNRYSFVLLNIYSILIFMLGTRTIGRTPTPMIPYDRIKLAIYGSFIDTRTWKMNYCCYDYLSNSLFQILKFCSHHYKKSLYC